MLLMLYVTAGCDEQGGQDSGTKLLWPQVPVSVLNATGH